MGVQIESAGLNANGMVVNSKGRALVEAFTFPGITNAAVLGSAFYIATDFVPLTTTGAFSGILYLKNTTSLQLRVSSIRTCGLTNQEWKLIRNPTAGTLISAGTALAPGNLLFSSGREFQAEAKVGVDGHTVTDGALLAQWINAVGHSREEFQGSITLDQNNTLALVCKPSVAADVCVSLQCWFGD